ncbi:MAG: starch-binding protein [Clostridia bacterium]|nr:starch-binding protein [Clostridia bacterium]
MKRILFLFALALSSMATMADYIVYYDNSSTNWSIPYVYAYNHGETDSDITSSWPGAQMNGSGSGTWSYTISGSYSNPGVIFSNNGSDQSTPDFELVDGATYNKNGIVYTLWFDNLYGWSDVKIWAWCNVLKTGNGNINEISDFKDRPSMTYDSETGLYKLTFTLIGAITGVKFDDGNDTADGEHDGYEQYNSVVNGGIYTSDSYTGYTDVEKYLASKSGGSGSTTNTYTVYFDRTGTSWNPVYVYIWDVDDQGEVSQKYCGNYPGVTMSLFSTDSSTLYYYTFTTTDELSANAKIIFSNGYSGTDNQTDNLDFVNGMTYTQSGQSTADNWFIYFDPTGVDGTITKVEVYMWHSAFGEDDADSFKQTDTMWKGTGENDSNYYVYSFYDNTANLGDQRIEVKFFVYTNDENTKTEYSYEQLSGTTQETDWYLVNHAIYGTSGFIKLNEDTSGYVTYTVYYKQSTDTSTDGSWSTVYIYVFNEYDRTDHYCNNPSWPGDPMTSLGDNQWKYTFMGPAEDSTHEFALDFNDGVLHDTGTSGATTQTTDMMFKNNGLFEYRYVDGESGQDGKGDALAAKNNWSYEVGAEIYVTSVGYATYYSDNSYVLPCKTDYNLNGNVPAHNNIEGYYFLDNVHGTAIINSAEVSDNNEDEDAYAGTAWFAEGSVVPARTALLLHSQASTDSDDTDFGADDTDVPSAGRYYLARLANEKDGNAHTVSNNMLYGSSSYVRTNVDGSEIGYKFYKLANDETSGLGFYYGANDGAAFVSEPNKAWLAVDTQTAAHLTAIFFEEEPVTPTGINTISASAAKKSGNAIYNLQGMRVKDMTQKGIYIVGGRKVVVR